MESVKDFFQSIYDSYKDRIKSPFIGSFMLSFLLFNWRVFAILFFSEWPMHCRIEWIEDKYCLQENFWYPVLISLFYILLLPYINLFFEWILVKHTKKKTEKKQANRTAELENKKIEANLLREIADAEAGTSEIKNLQTKIENLQKENNDLIEENKIDTQRWTERNAASHEKEIFLNQSNNELQERIKYLENYVNGIKKNYGIQHDSQFKNLSNSELSNEIIKTYNRLTKKECLLLIDTYGKDKNHIAYKYPESNLKSFYKFEEIGIVTIDTLWAELTTLGKYVVNYIENDYMES